MSKVTPCLWFNGNAEEAANFYVSLMPDSEILHVQRNVADNPSGKEGSVLVVGFTLGGQRFVALNGGMKMEYTHALSLMINCEDQAQVDSVWDAFLAHGGKAEQCGWLKDRYGVSWQVVPKAMFEFFSSSDTAAARRAMQAMMKMVKLDIEGVRRAFEGKSEA
ncbi:MULTISPECIES: VOC family protein [unclassified Bradyrhizobium]|uniref:VOC family protein n=1 Tax=unclassified Bradyrhizobium TaxID=2631580 RepID=UPI00247B1679|nr:MULTISPECIES: VOC family protein [unclassified Bradyrhizobium]WGR73554.1 VOC family protein [Bradyrhizobium sp. ISRA426]WGR78391.1 VOC family protein [Bradyrhizobium sp. ISRA430]WGR88793.1 VOC family protein [Bradyrhizobium sp. ISRA432]